MPRRCTDERAGHKQHRRIGFADADFRTAPIRLACSIAFGLTLWTTTSTGSVPLQRRSSLEPFMIFGETLGRRS
jgi:hypothetical protein